MVIHVTHAPVHHRHTALQKLPAQHVQRPLPGEHGGRVHTTPGSIAAISRQYAHIRSRAICLSICPPLLPSCTQVVRFHKRQARHAPPWMGRCACPYGDFLSELLSQRIVSLWSVTRASASNGAPKGGRCSDSFQTAVILKSTYFF